MTERGPRTDVPGAPNPAGPAHSGDAPAPPGRLPAVDLGAVRRTDAVIESLAAWRAAGSAGRAEGGRPTRTDEQDPAVRLLRALIADVDDQGPGRDARTGQGGPEPTPPGPGPRRRGPRTIVALGVAGAVLASSGVAAAGGGDAEPSTAAQAPAAPGVPAEPGESPAPDVDTGTVERPRPPAAEPAPRPVRATPRESSGTAPPGTTSPGAASSGTASSGTASSSGTTSSGASDRGDGERVRHRLRHPFPLEGRNHAGSSIVIMSTEPSITVVQVGPRVTIMRTAPSRRTTRSPETELRRRLEALRGTPGHRG